MRVRRYGDSGQAFPIYITVVGGLLFLALAYLAVGQAAVNRNGAQTAADAAALAAAMNTRDELADLWVQDVRDPTKWLDIFQGHVDVADSCWRADQLAAQNDATARCASDPPLAYEVDAVPNKTVGDSVVPGTENLKSTGHARAVIDSLCTFSPAGDDGALPELTCKGGRIWRLDPADLSDLPGPEDLFDVHLAD
ncbi:pilus assembly protein TadG-related protein [Streptomyces sp. Ag109_O5-10]|uniref:pilus assembly protein TadG-related protein n=1 Tax=Streptomyces sp. Ag109_O5-10 TaxID=1855349 RepID=UPI0015A69A8F|nr:pilus assembly protein TadG-related protein [Streptomyces sp. Ag109_O5-10]